jgi:hypothetical protein
MCQTFPELFEHSRQPLDLSRELALGAEALPGTGQTLNFVMEPQMQTEWCWTAVAVSVDRFYQPTSTIQQCQIANGELGRDDCCGGGVFTGCNIPHTLHTALSQVGHLSGPVEDEPTLFPQVTSEMVNARPLGCRIGWFGGGGHFVVIHGASTDISSGPAKQWVAVADPLFGPADYLIDDFTSAYRQEGEWTHSYFTQ